METKTLPLCLRQEATFPLYSSTFVEANDGEHQISFSATAEASFKDQLLVVNKSVDFVVTSVVEIAPPEGEEVVYTETYSPLSQDCTGRAPDLFDSTGNSLYFGNDGTGATRTWIPYQIDLSALERGAHLVSAYLSVTPQNQMTDKYCKINFGCDSLTSTALTSWPPTTWASLKAKVYGSKVTYTAVYNTDVTLIDISTAVRQLFKGGSLVTGTTTILNDVIVWPVNPTYMAVLAVDAGSVKGVGGSWWSKDGESSSDYNGPQLILNYAYNYYNYIVTDTYLAKSTPELPYPNVASKAYCDETIIRVGDSNSNTSASPCRGLIKFDVSQLDWGDFAMVSATLQLYLTSKYTNTASPANDTMKVYLSTKDWDLKSTSWNNQYGTKTWTTAGGDYSTLLGSINLNASSAVGSKSISLNTSAILPWFSDPTSNHGIELITTNASSAESNSQYTFQSSQSTVIDRRPKLTIVFTQGGETYTYVCTQGF